MKKYLVLTSIFALAACGGGGGGGSGGPGGSSTPHSSTPPITAVQGFSGGTTVNANNAELTNMSSYTVDYGTSENATKQAMVNYVQSKLGGAKGLSLTRSASSRESNRDGFTPEQFANADAALTQMKQVVYDLVTRADDPAALTTYVTRYRTSVIQALKLADQTVDDNASIGELITAFTTFKTSAGLTTENLVEKMDQFDHDEFEITKHRLDDVRLKDTGEEGFFKFKLDTAGKIQSVALMEDPTSEYGSSWANKRVILSDGHAVQTGPGEGGTLNPFDTDYLTDKAGVLVRNGTSFSNDVHYYKFQLGRYNEGTGALVLTSGHDASAMLQPDDLKKIEITSEAALTPETAKEQLVQYIIEKINKKIHNQDSNIDDDLQDAIEVANWYIDKINASIDTDAIAAANQGIIHQVATMHGMGKEDGVKLKYSDFGYASLTRSMPGKPNETQYLTYVGGYDDRRMDNAVLNDDLDGATFTGTAIVTVEDHHRNKTLDTESRKTALYKDTTAQLQYNIVGDKARHTLTMGGLKAIDGQVTTNSDWYSMVVQGTEDNPNLSVTFDATGKTIDSDYQFFRADAEGNITRNEANSIAAGDRIVNSTGTANTINMVTGTQSLIEEHHKLNGSASAEYYGQDPSNPTEATSGVWMDERWANDGNTIQHEVSVYGAFGGQKDAE
ncbi:MAG: hypothetical protein J5613_00985 [Alphaproteobacteria bacterium]|nr:hypothetical protein [Alphaproteobacteria bacterium]